MGITCFEKLNNLFGSRVSNIQFRAYVFLIKSSVSHNEKKKHRVKNTGKNRDDSKSFYSETFGSRAALGVAIKSGETFATDAKILQHE